MPEDSTPLDPALLKVIQALARAEALRDFETAQRDHEREAAPKRNKTTFTAAEIRRALSAVEAAGKTVGAVDFPPSGGFRLIIGEPPPSQKPNDWDDVLHETPDQALERWKRNEAKKQRARPAQMQP
ncbi:MULTISPECIES: hypothetical protein [unclassified Brevundimonas]|uniref:hypothetical protein n=1 Tax=unclassified Brevundimonas TaxID=2622653 RepID=UPI000CFCDDE5|nr:MULTISPECIES: hypothetical protein [unclassified Brevundimonas]PQZ79485.1 hypothetical protein CQ026_11955 [Brevundimonas sp. MYb31]PRB12993.1 hypothetical protein CQ039_13670 [Brevundimonas sp. MYb52]PRB33649.1 hypothetical protein CQ035_12850 [Brevundimonas sp. MYb46]PRB48902.1 hypothetical protein CQ028_08950 [Brevundimonas sp. MYb33]